MPQPFFREAGEGPAVVCLHSNASTSGQWRGLMERLAPNFRVLAVDSYGAGKTPAWTGDRPITLGDEVALEVVVSREGMPTAIRVVRSLDPGLDGEAIAAARQWRFVPGRVGDTPVDVVVTILLDFNVR